MNDTSNLVSLLEEAAKRFRVIGGQPIWSSIRDDLSIAEFIELVVSDIQAGSLTHENAYELWTIFAPTCNWDDCVGDCDLGQKIFEAIESDLIKHRKVKS